MARREQLPRWHPTCSWAKHCARDNVLRLVVLLRMVLVRWYLRWYHYYYGYLVILREDSFQEAPEGTDLADVGVRDSAESKGELYGDYFPTIPLRGSRKVVKCQRSGGSSEP